jgi:putative peptide zinc metalloprotease protein
MATPPQLGDRAQRLKLGPELRRMSQVWLEKGLTLCALSRYEEALAAFEKSLALETRNPRAWYNKGLTLATLGRYEEALAAYDAALKVDEARAFIWLQKGLALTALERHAEALAALDRAVELDPTDAIAWQHRGAALYRLGRFEAALAAYDRTLELDDDRTVVWKARGSAVNVELPAEDKTLRLGPGWLTVATAAAAAPPAPRPAASPPGAPTPGDTSPAATRPAMPRPPSAGRMPDGGVAHAKIEPGIAATPGTGRTGPSIAQGERSVVAAGALPVRAAPLVDTEPAARDGVPAMPRLAANVKLHGQMKESGFQQTQWLVERDGRFIQLTELLYRVVELCDGAHTLEAIAAGAGAESGKNLSAENVRYLLATRLIPTQLVQGVEGAEVPQPAGGAPAVRMPARSPLSVNLRFAPFSPRVVNGAAEVFKHLFAPPIVVVAVLVALAGQVWLYRFHRFDFGAALRQAYTNPALLAAALGLTALATLFHEIGHASALRYGGGRARRMGMGFYLMVPVFYTDVTENYRLGRWARIRTDLGGFYFNLLADLVFFGLFFATHQPLLLFAVAATNIEILVNLLPFGRFDGYWALADLTGIPDFFSLMGPFLRSLPLLRWWRGTKLPPLKPWVRRVYFVYTLIAVPLLALIFAELFLSIPTSMPHLVRSIGGFVQLLIHAEQHGNRQGMAVALVNILVLAIILVPMVFMLLSLARTLLTVAVALPRRLVARRRVGVAS